MVTLDTASDVVTEVSSGGSASGSSTAINNLGQPVSLLEEINQLSSGIVTASATGLPLVDAAQISTLFASGGSLFITDLSGLPVVGTYDFGFQADLSSKTLVIDFTNVSVPGLGLSSSFLDADGSLPPSGGEAFLEGQITSTLRDAGCISAGCGFRADALTINGNALGGISHHFFLTGKHGNASLATSGP